MNAALKTKLKGALSLLLLFGEGINAFSGERKPALLSFLIPLALFPVGVWAGMAYPPRGTQEGYSDAFILQTVLLLSFFGTLFPLALVCGAAWMFGRARSLWRYFEASNWAALVGFVLLFPFFLLAISGWAERDTMDRLFILLTAYLYIVAGCIANRTIAPNWQLAGAVACFVAIGDQEAGRFTYYLMEIPYPWDY